MNEPLYIPAAQHPGGRCAAGRGWLAAMVCAAVAPWAMGQGPGKPAGPPANGQPAAVSTDPGQLMTVLLDPAADAGSRDAAADQMVRMAGRPEVARLLSTLLRDAQDPDRAKAITLGAISRSWSPPARLFRPLAELVDQNTRLSPEALFAIGAYRTREAAQILIRFLAREKPTPERDAAVAALVRMTGREDLWGDPAAAAAWLASSHSLSNEEWEDLLAQGVWRRMQRLEADQRAAAERLTEGYRRLYLALPASPGEERAKLLSQMLLGARPELRKLGIEIVSRELSAGKSVEPTVTEAALSLLASPDPAVRTAAAGLVMQLAPAGGGGPVAAALAKETDPGAAAALLQAIARWPSDEAIEPSLRWLKTGQGTYGSAVESVFALHTAGNLRDVGDRATVLAALRDVESAKLTPAGCRLLAALGTRDDRDRVSRLIEGDLASMRLAAAGALADRPEYFDRIMTAAEKDPSLFPVAVRAVSEARPTAAGYDRLAQLRPPTPEDLHRGLLDATAALSAADLLEVAKRPGTDLQLREEMLSRLAQHGPAPRRMGEEDSRAIMEGLLLLAETRLALRRPDLAVAALESVPPSPGEIDPAKLAALRTVALIGSNQLEAARQVNAPCDVWLDGLERSLGDPHAAAIIEEIKALFGATMTPEQQERLKRLTARVSLTDAGEVEHPIASGEHLTDGGR